MGGGGTKDTKKSKAEIKGIIPILINFKSKKKKNLPPN